MNLIEFIRNNAGFASGKAHNEFRYQLCIDSLEITKGNKTKASELLGISRVTFNTWYGI